MIDVKTRADSSVVNITTMKFSAHRRDDAEDDGYDSLWSDSEEDEFPVNPSDSEEAYTVDEEEDEEEEEPEFTSTDEVVNSRSYKRRSLLFEMGQSPKFRDEKSRPSPSRRRSYQPGLISQEQLHLELEQLSINADKWSDGHRSRYEKLNAEEQESVRRQQGHVQATTKDGLETIQKSVSDMTLRRRSKIQSMRDIRAKLQELIEEEEREEQERIQREKEEEERKLAEERAREEAEKQRLIDEERKLEEEKRQAQEEAKKKAEEEAKKKRDELEKAAKDRADKIAEEKAKAEESARQIREQEQAQSQAKQSSQNSFTDWNNVNQEFLFYKQKIADIKANILAPVSEDKQMKNFCFLAKRKIKPKVGQVTPDIQQIDKILKELQTTFEEAQSKGELVYLWCLNFFAKAVVQQAETEVTVSTNSAQALAIICTKLMVQNPPLIDLLIARFVKKCPQVIGFECSIDTEEGRIRMGHKKRNDKWEDDAQYSERIGGITVVWACLTITRFGASSTNKHPYPMKHGWIFLARHLNKSPDQLNNATFASVAAWWDAAAHKFLEAFGRQGHKLLELVWNDFTNSVADQRYPAAARLRLLGEDWKRTGVATKGVSNVA